MIKVFSASCTYVGQPGTKDERNLFDKPELQTVFYWTIKSLLLLFRWLS